MRIFIKFLFLFLHYKDQGFLSGALLQKTLKTYFEIELSFIIIMKSKISLYDSISGLYNFYLEKFNFQFFFVLGHLENPFLFLNKL